MAQYFTERLQKVFHMIFRSYNQKAAQEGLRQLELIVNNQQVAVSTTHRALRNDMSTLLESEIKSKEDALKIANDPEARELGDAYALLARVYAVLALRGRNLISQRTICAPINAYTIVFAVVVLLVPYKHCALKALLRLLWKRIANLL